MYISLFTVVCWLVVMRPPRLLFIFYSYIVEVIVLCDVLNVSLINGVSAFFFFPQMKYVLIAILVTLAVVAARPETYTSRFDNVDVDRILNTKRLFDSYFKCLMDNGKCTPDGKELKKLLPDALKTNCEKCTEKQRDGTDRVLRFIVHNKPEEWKQLKAKYDPDNIYIQKYRESAAARGITI